MTFDSKPIPSALLGDSFTLLEPVTNGWKETLINNVRVERVSEVTDYSAAKARSVTKLYIWFDLVNSRPFKPFEAGMKANYHGEIYEIIESKVLGGAEPHHYKLAARKIGGEYTEGKSI